MCGVNLIAAEYLVEFLSEGRMLRQTVWIPIGETWKILITQSI